jgi:dephospho-CoA kinase
MQEAVISQGAVVSAWPGKYVIGLTGNIGTGKSVVRKMLEHLGAYGIDADALSHRAIAKGAPGFQPVVETFGRWLLDPQGQIDRAKLGRLVFNDSEAMKGLEAIVHPLVRQAVEVMATRASQRVIVVEAIKLLEGSLRASCDSVWVTTAPENLQLERLMRKRGMGRDEALARIHAQPPQEDKISVANVVIDNTGSFEETWQQVLAAWKQGVPQLDAPPIAAKTAAEGEFSVVRGRPRDSAMIAELITRLSAGTKPTSQEDVMAAFGERAFLLLQLDGKPVGIAGWQVENLVARTTEFFIDPAVPMEAAFKTLIAEVEQASLDLQCETSLLFVQQNLAAQETSLKQLGYERRTPQSLGVQAWHEAAIESAQPGTVMFFKQLRQDRVLRPI